MRGDEATNLRPWRQVWLPCEVKPGAFSSERLVRVVLHGQELVNFVDERQLRDPVLRGQTFVRANLDSVLNDVGVLFLPGEPRYLRMPLGAVASVQG